MDLWFGNHPKNERECQQLMLWENNIGNSAKSTDYFICDMAGNVMEWTSSIYSGSFRVLRDGSWGDLAYFCSFSYWSIAFPYDTNHGFGFRVCR
jgi:formylglycine-generating enzyme required for sulfatase activity